MEFFQESILQDDPERSELLRAIAEHEWPWQGEYVIAAFDLGVCADESGIHDDAVVCLLAGYIASVKQWMLFDERWKRVLEEFDVLDFHSKEFFPINAGGERVGRYNRWSNPEERAPYGDWPDTKIDKFLDRLLGIIHDGRLNPIGASVRVADFLSFTYGERKYLTGGKYDGRTMKWVTSGAPHKPYFLVYDHCLVHATKKTKVGLKTLFVFDQQKQFESRALQQFGESVVVLSRDPEQLNKRFAGVIFEDRRTVRGLQAADLYAHCWYRYLCDANSLGTRTAALDRLTEKEPGMKWYDCDFMAGLFRNLPPNVREAIRVWSEDDDR